MEFVEEMKSEGETLWDPYVPAPKETAHSFVQRLLDRETNPPSPMVPETVYWATQGELVVGRISLRHRLEGNLTKIGGHVGYEVRPSFRRQGIATETLRLILLTAKAKEIGKLLLTCSPTNMASNKTIIANDGKLIQTIYVDLVKEDRNHYWIEL
jgi:predicted acetyltransferase